MKIWKNKFLKQMIIIITLVFVILNGMVPPKVYADKSNETIIGNLWDKLKGTASSAIGYSKGISGESDWGIGNIFGNLVKELIYLVIALGDVGMAAMQVTLLGDANFWIGTMVSNKNDNLENPESWLYATTTDVDALQDGGTSDRGSMLVIASSDGLKNGVFQAHWKVPNMLYSPENIFSNKIAALDANYINPHEYEPVRDSEEAERESQSFAGKIRPTIASWYRAFRNIAIVALLSVLVYIAIRILIGSVNEKAKYKERLTDWFIALCLVFFMHFIMAGIMMIAEKITDLFDQTINSGIIVSVDDGTIFRTSFTGYIRFASQSDAWTEALGYGVMYIFIVGLTLRYTFIYMKRALYIAFFTMMAPLVAITYPIDKAGDGKAQAFNYWIKEYFINAILQPLHLVLYSALVGAAITLVVENPIYGIVALLFISTAEKWVKKMFKMDAPMSATSLGDVALLGSVMNMGKNIIGGIGKTVALGALTVATGGIGGAAAGAAGAAGAATGAAGATGGAIGGVAEGAGAIGGIAEGAGAATGSTGMLGRAGAALVQGSLEDAVTGSESGGGSIGGALLGGGSGGSDISSDVAQQLQELDTNNLQHYNDVKSRQQAQEINSHTVDANTLEESAPNPQIVSGQNLEDVSGVQKPNEEAEEQGKDDPKVKYYKDYAKDKLIKKVTDKDPGEELVDMLIKGAGGAAAAIPGAMAGVFGAGLTGGDTSKAAIAGAMGGANVGSNIASTIMSTGDTIFNNNVKVLVKDGNMTKEDIIKNTAQIATQKHWSESKMTKVGQMAEKYPNSAKDKEAQKEIKKIMEEQGVSKQKLDQVIKDIIQVQSGIEKTGKQASDQVKKDLEKWK